MAAAALLPGESQAQGGPPLMTDDPYTPGNRHWEVNTALTLAHQSGTTLLEVPLADANYGLGDRLQLKLEVPLQVERRDRSRSGLGRPVMRVKWRIRPGSDSEISVSTYPQLEFRSPILPLSDADDDKAALFLPLELARSWGFLAINGEGGYRLVQDGFDQLGYGLALGYTAAPRLELLSECNGSYEPASSRMELICQLGAREQIGRNLSLLGAVGRAVAAVRTEHLEIQAYLGLQSRW